WPDSGCSPGTMCSPRPCGSSTPRASGRCRCAGSAASSTATRCGSTGSPTARTPCSTAWWSSCSTSWSSGPTGRGGRRCCASPATRSGPWRWRTPTWCRCWSPARSPRHWACVRRASCGRSRSCSNCSPGRGSTGAAPCTPTASTWASCTGTCCTSCRSGWPTRTRPTTCCGWACTGCRSGRSPACAGSPPSWPTTTGPGTSTRGWAWSSPDCAPTPAAPA
ncbi:MAG: Transcriptional regulator, AcrR family, partial [uncultured Pseudonocardia sp.]